MALPDIVQATRLAEIVEGPATGILMALLIVYITGSSLYKAAKLNEKKWFWALMILNPLAILSVIYLYIRRNKKV